MKLALCQINTTVADFKGNVSKILEGMAWAKKKKADLAVFPEMAVFGYPPRDLLDKPYLIEKNIEAAEKIASQTTNNFACVFGFVDRNPSKIGRGLYNTAALAFDGKIQTKQAKSLLPTYDVFDEARHFDPAQSHFPISFKGVAIGLTVCEDIWSAHDFEGKQYYDLDPVAVLKENGAELIINISASPFHVGKWRTRRQLIAENARGHQVPIVYCNLTGGNDDLVFDGQSLVANAKGKIVFEGKRFQEELVLVDLAEARPVSKLLQPSPVEEIHDCLILGLKDYARKCRFKKAVLGLSGGIDSSVVAALAAEALGPKNVLGLSMPSPYSSAGSLKDAKTLAKNLGIQYRIIPIRYLYEEYLKTLELNVKKNVPLVAENIQARIRGNILMAVSNQEKALVLSTGNKSELACGYCTLYGDLAGGLAILSDVPKTDVYALARHINRKKKMIPEEAIRKPPSAELRPNQKDQDTLPPYPVLDKILRAYIEEHLSREEIVKQGFSKKMVEEVIGRIDHNEYKRRQAPPGIKVTSKAFGIGRRFPIAWGY